MDWAAVLWCVEEVQCLDLVVVLSCLFRLFGSLGLLVTHKFSG